MTLATFIQASAHQLTGIADGSVQAIVTSPPYYGLRKYEGDQDIEWPAVEYAPLAGLPALTVPAMRSALGNEPTLEAYIGHLVLCLREWRRVLRDDGCCFVNLGDSFAGSGGAGGDYNEGGLRSGQPKFKAGKSNGLKPKDLMLVPARFALAAQADGFWLRSDIIGAKVAPMPESVTDRPTRSHEHIFMLTKASRYFWDSEGVKEKGNKPAGANATFGNKNAGARLVGKLTGNMAEGVDYFADGTRNMRDVIEWRPSGFSGSHFAVWPEAIPEKLIRAATSERGCCPTCGAALARVVERMGGNWEERKANGHPTRYGMQHPKGLALNVMGGSESVTIGWQPSCTCPAADPVPCVVLDPFSGSGTTVKVAVRLGRKGIGVDVCAAYLDDVTALRFGSGVQMELVQP